jgi:uncharacterized protein YdiU (UPF0061 family)
MGYRQDVPPEFDNTYARLPERFFARVTPAKVPDPTLIRVNDDLAGLLGIDPAWLRSDEGLGMVSGNQPPPGAEPIAQAYAGHQFGGFVPQLGDGRAILLGEIVGTDGIRRDVQLKGSGITPFSRNGDGKAALGPALREYLVSEAMHALGVPTTRALAVVTTGESVLREDPLPGAVFTRVASSHLRVGTFEYFAARDDVSALRTLADFAIARHFPDAAEAENPALALLGHVIAAQARLIPRWLGLGFIHGVMNTDNCAISGETIDFGPCAFMDTFHPRKVFSSIDRRGRYAWGNQPSIAHWNLIRFAETLLPLLSDDLEKAKELATDALDAYPNQLLRHHHAVFRAKLGLPDDAPPEFIDETLRFMAEQEADFTLFFRHLTRFATDGDKDSLRTLIKSPASLDPWLDIWSQATRSTPEIASMKAANPVLIPRNHRIEQAIQDARRGDFALFHRLADAWTSPFDDRSEHADLEAAPQPDEVVRETFCGT